MTTPDPDQGTPVEKAGRAGLKFADGSILWADGEREYPVSGISDETKRAEARAAAEVGFATAPTKEGVSAEELDRLEARVSAVTNPQPSLAERKATAKEAARLKPADRKAAEAGLTRDQADHGLRVDGRAALNREIDRLEELKSLAVAGAVEIGYRGLPVAHRNPPMALHDAILALITAADTANPANLVTALRSARDWQPLVHDPVTDSGAAKTAT